MPGLDSALVLCEEANGWMLCESKDALTELQARRKAAEDKEVKL